MDFMAGNLSRMIFHRFDLPLPVFRGSKGHIWTKLSLQQLWRPLRIHIPLVPANAVIMWCMVSYRMLLLDRAPVCMGGEGVYIYFSIAPSKVPFFPLFCSMPGSGYFFFDSIAVYVFVVCMYVSVWCGGSPLSLSLWIVAGMVVGWQHSRAEGEGQ
jgi:hypothetical protein